MAVNVRAQAGAQIVQSVGAMRRKVRSPIHTFAIQHRPYQLQPFFIAPVLPGETMTNLTLNGRAITDPLAVGMGNILPWWHETYFYYVRLRDLDIRDDVENMMLNGVNIGVVDAAADAYYHQGGTINWLKACMKRITEEYFRDEGEDWALAATNLDGLPMAAAVKHEQNWADNLSIDTGPEPTNNPLQVPEGERDPLAAHLEAYERMRAMMMVDMTFAEWLRLSGVSLPDQEARDNVPEEIRYASNWSYPTNTIEPTTGVPSAAVAWSVSERADKDRFFREPGFLVGVTCVRAKIFMGNQRGTAASMLDDEFGWLAPMFRDRPEAALKKFVGPTSPTGPLRGQTNDYWVDLRDLFIHGDQFLAGIGTLPQAIAPALPDAAGEKRFLTSAQINALFASATVNKVRQDGRVSLAIKAHATTATDVT